MRLFRLWIGLVVMMLCAAWPFVAGWLSGHQLISSTTERATSLLCLLGAVAGALYYRKQFKTGGPVGVVLGWFAPFCVVLAIVLARGTSDNMFTYWLMKRIPGHAWQQMAFDLEVLAKKKWDENEPGLGANELPKSLDASVAPVGLPEL
jgi:hypothetical protein